MQYYLPNFKFAPGNAVEFDEMRGGRRAKHHSWRAEPIWMLNGVQHVTNLVVSYVVDDRTNNTLVPLICKHVHPYQRVCTDCHAEYNTLITINLVFMIHGMNNILTHLKV